MTNLFKRFERLLPKFPLRIGEVVATDGTETVVEELGGLIVRVRGTATVGSLVYMRNGVIEGPAPSLPIEVITE